MKQYKQTLLSLLISILTLSFPFAEDNAYEQSQGSDEVSNSQCNIQNDASLFVLESIFTNLNNPYPVELWHNRDNEKINIFDIAREIKSIAKVKETVFKDTHEAERSLLFERLSQMEDIADCALLMEADKWKASYVNELMKHIIGIRHAGISGQLPDSVDLINCKKDEREIMNPCDKKGVHWTGLSQLVNSGAKGPSIANYMKDNGADIKLIKDWWSSQQQNSWCQGCNIVKFFYVNQRTLDPLTYYWRNEEYFDASTGTYLANGGYKSAGKLYASKWENQFLSEEESNIYTQSCINAFTIWHAYVQEVLSKISFPHNNQNNKEVCLTRTIDLNALYSNNITRFGKGYTMPSAAYDSYSLASIVWENHLFQGIIQSRVPHHRILHLYPLLENNLQHIYQRYLYQAEFIVLSGPDLQFDYFYNTGDDLSPLKESFKNGKDACPGFRLSS